MKTGKLKRSFTPQDSISKKGYFIIAVCSFLILALAKKKLGLEQSLYTISQTLGFVLFEKVPINQLFNKNQNSVSTDEYPNLFSIS